ncbi:MAG: MATE family efflux transporter [Bacteroides sp.]|nr:MATE family efflux transporter [Prevotella sp.]MCM1408884.1 MATE family efflux transporter [Treponema brennaborense]MCM1470855.1 MATE family efflux transporter [Bacteroides sp.]
MAADIILTQEEKIRRKFMLEGSEWRVIFSIALPLVFYNGLNQIFQFFDTLIAAQMSSKIVSAVSFIQQIHTMLTAVGSGLSIGGGIIIAREYGAGNMEQVSKNISTVFFAALGIGGCILAVCIPAARPFLRLLNMPEDLLAVGTIYFMVEITSLAAIFINTIYLMTEKSRGNTKKIMLYNTLVLCIKTSLTVLFVVVLKINHIIVLGAATLLAHSTLTCIAIRNLTKKSNPFCISLKKADFHAGTLKPIFTLSAPVFLEKFAFSFGKVLVNSMVAVYGSSAVGALGVSNRIGGIATNPPSGFQEAESTLISQNIGNNNTERALRIFGKTFFINSCTALLFFLIMYFCRNFLTGLFARGDPEFAAEISKIYQYEMYGSLLMSASTSVMGLLYGLGCTRVSMTLNIIRLFVYRIPPLWILQKFFPQLGTEGVGIAMLISNSMTGITATITAAIIIRRIKIKAKQTPQPLPEQKRTQRTFRG